MLNRLRTLQRWIRDKRDLSPIIPVSPPFDSDQFRGVTDKLTDQFIRRHALEVIDQGFTVIPRSVPTDLIEEAVHSFHAWKKRNSASFLQDFYKYDDKLDRVVNIHGQLPSFRQLFVQNRAVQVQDHLFQAQTAFYTCLFFEVGSAQAIHRDIPVFWTKPASMYFGT